MFGLYFTVFALVAALIAKIQIHRDNIDWNRNSKENAIKEGREEFIMCDHDTYQNLKTGKMYKYRRNENGDLLRVAQNGKLIENVTETKRNEDIARQKAERKSEFYVESVAYPTDYEKTKRRRMNVQTNQNLVRAVDSRTGIDYFRVRAGSAYYYQNLDTAMFDFAEIVPEERGNSKVKFYTRESMGKTVEVDNTPENLSESMKLLNEGRKATIRTAMEWKHCSYEDALDRAYALWGTASLYDLYEEEEKCSDSVS